MPAIEAEHRYEVETAPAEPELTERQKVQAEQHPRRQVLPAGTRRLIVVLQDGLEDFRKGITGPFSHHPIAVYEPEGVTFVRTFRSIDFDKVIGRMVPFKDELIICGERRINHLAIETSSEIVGRW